MVLLKGLRRLRREEMVAALRADVGGAGQVHPTADAVSAV